MELRPVVYVIADANVVKIDRCEDVRCIDRITRVVRDDEALFNSLGRTRARRRDGGGCLGRGLAWGSSRGPLRSLICASVSGTPEIRQRPARMEQYRRILVHVLNEKDPFIERRE